MIGWRSLELVGCFATAIYLSHPNSIGALPMAVQAVAAGGCHSAAISSDGVVYTWGCGRHGQLGLGDRRELQPVPHAVRQRTLRLGTFCFVLVVAKVGRYARRGSAAAETTLFGRWPGRWGPRGWWPPLTLHYHSSSRQRIMQPPRCSPQ